MRTDNSVDAPADSIEWVKNLFVTRQAERPNGILKRIAAILSVDIPANSMVFGERSTGAGKVRQMLFTAGDNAVDLRIEELIDGVKLKGQFLSTGSDTAKVSLRNDRETYSVETDGSGEFGIENVAHAIYSLTITTDDLEISIENVDLTKQK